MRQSLITITLSLLVGAILMRYCSAPRITVRERVKTDTVTMVRVDTIRIDRPIPVRIVDRRVDTLVVYRGADTIYVPVPIRQHQYRDTLYALDVSGYNVSIDRLEVYPRTVTHYITKEIERIRKDKRRFGIGLQAGYGYNFDTRKLSPYLGIGVQWNVIRF